MPRKKQGPRRLDEEEQRSSTFVMGGDGENNEQQNRELTGRLASAPASQVDTIVRSVSGEQEQGEGSLYTVPVASSQSKMYSVIFDDDDDEYQSSEDEDFNPAAETKNKKKSPKKSPQKTPHIFQNPAESVPVDEELQALVEDAEFNTPVLERASSDAVWHSAIGDLEVRVDLQRQGLGCLELPGWGQGFQLYITRVPGRSIVLFERFEMRTNETENEFRQREREGCPNDSKYFYLEDFSDKVHELLTAFSVKQDTAFLKYQSHKEGVILLKICVHERSFTSLTHPSDITGKVHPQVKRLLDHCFDFPVPDLTVKEAEDLNQNHDIDELYDLVKMHHATNREERAERVQLNPQHPSLIPRLRPYQEHAVKWMLEQERYRENLDPELREDIENTELQPLFREVEAQDGTIMYYSPVSGYLLSSRPTRERPPLGGILADEMGLGKTVEILSLMLSNPRPRVSDTEYLEPIIIRSKKKKKSRRRRTPSPVEFVLRGESEEENDVNIAQVDGNNDTDISDDESDEVIGTESSDAEYQPTKAQRSNKAKCSKKKNPAIVISSDEDYEPSEAVRVKTKTSRRNNQSQSNKPVFSDNRTVYYHEDFDSMSSGDEVVIPKPTKRKVKPGAKTANKRAAESQGPSNGVKKVKKEDSNENKKGPKIIDTVKKTDNSHPTFVPFRNGKFNEKTKDLYQQVVRAVQVLTEGKKATEGVVVRNIKTFLEKQFKRNITNKQFAKRLDTAIQAGISQGQFIKTSPKGRALSITLNLHFDPDDSRALFYQKPLGPEDEIIESVITSVCYEDNAFEPPHVPDIFEKNLAALEKKKSEKGELYKKMRSMYENSLPISLAFYASDKRSKEWNREHFATKVEQRAYFECLCGGTEEGRERAGDVGYRVQCSECGTEQHAECVKYDIQDPYRGSYYCPHCWVTKDKIQSGATLIVSPSSISFQWIEEIQKHIRQKDVRMLFYKGSKESGYIQPRTLGSYDIVITTYEVLAAETNYVDLPHSNSTEGRRFRNPKRYMAMPSPLTSIQWWRICLDEAQMIESTQAKTAEMALRLSAVNKWCVTGTPVGKSLNDLYGLLLFLQLDPYRVEAWWRLAVYTPYCLGDRGPMLEVLRGLLWRTSKRDVLDQIDIPDQSDEVSWLQFSPVEEHFYRRQHIEISRDVVTKLRRLEPAQKLSALDRQSLSTLLLPLLKLRQACCHPQAVRGQFMSLQKQTMTMDQLLEQLITKAKLETEEAHRGYIAALNGLAGIDIIEEKWVDAVERYRDVLRSAEEHKERIKTDTLQRLHTVTNLASLLEAEHPGVAPTLRDTELKPLASELRSYYMNRYHGGLTGAKDAVVPVTKVVDTFYSGFRHKMAWYEAIVDWAGEADQEKQLMTLVHEEMSQFFDVVNEKEMKEVADRYPNSRIVLYKIFEKLSELDKNREAVTRQMRFLSETNPENFLNKAIDCHLRVSSVSTKYKNKCKLCEVHDAIEVYENILFHFVKGEIKGSKRHIRDTLGEEERKNLEAAGVFLHDEQKRGTWSDSEPERLLRAVLKYARQRENIFAGTILDDGNNQMRLLENLKKEFRLTRIYWRQIFDGVAGVDELNMCTMRLRLRTPEDKVDNQDNWFLQDRRDNKGSLDLATRTREKAETIYLLAKHELEPQRLKLVADQFSSQGQLRKKLGQLQYLENLGKTDYGKRGGSNPEPCPICTRALGTQWSVLQCGHCYCVDCIRIMIDEYSTRKAIKCAVCRTVTAHAEISYVSTKVEEEEQLEDVKGSHSTKVEAVLRCLMRIRAEDESAKTLVFSTWPDVLDILAQALDENNIPHAALHKGVSATQNKYKRNIQKFKNRGDVKVLLMPISHGANGLNLVEANHVILTEPLLNPAQELQAIGRVHRIGQKRKTWVHRFLVQQTIEERIHGMLKTHLQDQVTEEQGSHSTEENLLTIRDLSNIFVDNEEEEAVEAGGAVEAVVQ